MVDAPLCRSRKRWPSRTVLDRTSYLLSPSILMMTQVLRPEWEATMTFNEGENTRMDKHEQLWPEKSQKPERKDLGTKGREHQVSGAMKQAAGEIETKAGEMFGSTAAEAEGT